MSRLLITLLLPLFITACGSADDDTDYNVSLSLGDITKGVADINITITSEDGTAAEGDVIITPIMEMTSGMVHSTPVAQTSGALNSEGQFSSTAYFLMPSGQMGSWYVDVTFANKTTRHDIMVDMSMADRQQLKGGISDQISQMEMAVARPYYLYDLGRHVSSTMNTFTVYIAARETLMDYKSISDSVVLNAGSTYELNTASVVVEMCSDNCNSEGNWKTAMANSERPGEYTADQLNLNNDNNDSVEVRLTVAGERKTSDGTQEGNNATFSFDDSTAMPMNM